MKLIEMEHVPHCPTSHPLTMLNTVFSSTVVGGVFDHLHLGHQSLLQVAFQFSETVHVTVMGEKWISKRKKESRNGIESFSKRLTNVRKFLDQFGLSERTVVSKITDPFSYGVKGEKARELDSIVVSLEKAVKARTERLNTMRSRRGFSPLKILEMPLLASPMGKVFSSTRIRQEGKETGRRGMDFGGKGKTLVLPEREKSELRETKGKVASSVEALPPPPKHVISIGDSVTKSLAKAGYPISIAIIDQKVRRKNVSSLRLISEESGKEIKLPPYLPCKNPPGTLTQSALFCLKVALFQENPVVMRIYGEEDLMGLPLTAIAPKGTLILYGQPPRFGEGGIVYFRVTKRKRNEAIKLLKKMKER